MARRPSRRPRSSARSSTLQPGDGLVNPVDMDKRYADLSRLAADAAATPNEKSMAEAAIKKMMASGFRPAPSRGGRSSYGSSSSSYSYGYGPSGRPSSPPPRPPPPPRRVVPGSVYEAHPEWGQGPWADEPMEVPDWVDPATGLVCSMWRNFSGAWCGYVGVPSNHRLHGVGYDDAMQADGEWINVHGGLTFAGERASRQGEYERDIGFFRPADIWWLGFDCNHMNDQDPSNKGFGGDYRDIYYVRKEIAYLAEQIGAAESTSGKLLEPARMRIVMNPKRKTKASQKARVRRPTTRRSTKKTR